LEQDFKTSKNGSQMIVVLTLLFKEIKETYLGRGLPKGELQGHFTLMKRRTKTQ
jgi:hypothetical protein